MPTEILEIDGVDLRKQGFGVATRTGRYNLPSRRGENLVLAGASGSKFAKNKPFEEGFGALSCWAIGATTGDVVLATNLATNPSFETAGSLATVETNLLTNPSGEFSGGWASNNGTINTVSFDTSLFRSGTRSVKSVLNSGQTSTLLMSMYSTGLTSSTRPGFGASQPISAGAWFRTDQTGYRCRVRVACYDSGGTFLGTYLDGPWVNLTANTWTRATLVNATTLVNTASVYVMVEVATQSGANATPGHAAWVDDAMLVNERGMPDYFDGNTPTADEFTYAWSGTAHQSTSLRRLTGVAGLAGGVAGLGHSADWASTGTKSLRVYSKYHISGSAYVDLGQFVDWGKTYTVGARVRIREALTAQPYIGAFTLNNGTNLPVTSAFAPSTAPGVYDVKLTFTLPANGGGQKYLRLYNNNAYGTNVWFDDLYIIEDTTGSYFSGDTTGTDLVKYRWTGTAHASTSQKYMAEQRIVPNTLAGQRQAFEDNLNRLLRLFTRPHKLSTIRAAQPDGSIRRAQVEWQEWSEPEVMAGGTRAEFGIGYVIPSVWWEDENSTTQAATAGATLPKTLDLTSFNGMTGIIEDAVLTVAGPITNPRITDEESGAYIEYTGTVPTGQSWVIDVAAATSQVNNVSVMTNTKHAGNFKLFVIPNCYGTTDTPRLTLSGSAGGTATNLSVTARRKWATG